MVSDREDEIVDGAVSHTHQEYPPHHKRLALAHLSERHEACSCHKHGRTCL